MKTVTFTLRLSVVWCPQKLCWICNFKSWSSYPNAVCRQTENTERRWIWFLCCTVTALRPAHNKKVESARNSIYKERNLHGKELARNGG